MDEPGALRLNFLSNAEISSRLSASRRWPVAGCLLVTAVVPRGSAVSAVAWPWPELSCAEQYRTPVQERFAAPESVPEDVHRDIAKVTFGRYGGRRVAVSVGGEGTLRLWSLPGLVPVGDPVRVDPNALGFPEVEELTARRERRPAVISRAGRPTKVFIDYGGEEALPPPYSVTLADAVSGKEVAHLKGDFLDVSTSVVDGRTVLVTANHGTERSNRGVRWSPPGTVSLWDPLTFEHIALLGLGPVQNAVTRTRAAPLLSQQSRLRSTIGVS